MMLSWRLITEYNGKRRSSNSIAHEYRNPSVLAQSAKE
jgi:hypothetical protein